MAHQRVYRAAVDGKHPVNKASRLAETFAYSRRLAFAAAAFFAASTAVGHAQSGPFAGMAGNWSGGGTVTLDDGSRERLRCRASYKVAGVNMTMSLTCASDAYKFLLEANVIDERGQLTGTWTESSRNIAGVLQGRGSGGNFQVLVTTAGFNANISLRTAGNKQTVTLRADGMFRGADISLSK
ncbi:MAG TPA: hypothetical protein VGD96_05640 [Bradyrhizobium sp.]